MAALESCSVLIPAVPAAEEARIFDVVLNIIKNSTDIRGEQGPSGPSWRSPLGDVITDVYFSPTASEDAVCDPDALDATIVFHRPADAKYFAEIAKTEFSGLKLMETQVFNAVVAHVHPEVVATLQSRGILEATSQRMKHIGGIVIHNEPRFAIKGLMAQVFACGNVLQTALKTSATVKTEARVPSTTEVGDNSGPINGPNASFTKHSRRAHFDGEHQVNTSNGSDRAEGPRDSDSEGSGRGGTALTVDPVVIHDSNLKGFLPSTVEQQIVIGQEGSDRSPSAAVAQSVALEEQSDKRKVNAMYGHTATLFGDPALWYYMTRFSQRLAKLVKRVAEKHRIEINHECDNGSPSISGTTQEDVDAGLRALELLYGGMSSSVQVKELEVEWPAHEDLTQVQAEFPKILLWRCASGRVCIVGKSDAVDSECELILKQLKDYKRRHIKLERHDTEPILRDSAARGDGFHGLSQKQDHKGFPVDEYASDRARSARQTGERTGPVQPDDEEIDAICARTDALSLSERVSSFEVDRYCWQYLTNRQQKKLGQIENKYSVKLTTHNDGLSDVIQVTGQDDVMVGKAKSELERTYTSVAYSLTTEKTKLNNGNTISIAQLKKDKHKLLINEEDNGIIAITGLSDAVTECCKQINGEGQSRSEQATGRQDMAERGIATDGRHGATSGHLPRGVPLAATSGQVPRGVPPAATSDHVSRGVPPSATSEHIPRGVAPAATSGQVSWGVPSAATSGHVPRGVPLAATSGQVTRGVPLAATSGQVTRGVSSTVNTPEKDSSSFQSCRLGMSLDVRNNASSVDIRHSGSDGKVETYDRNHLGDNNGLSRSEAAGRRHDNSGTWEENLPSRSSDNKDAFLNPEGGIGDRQHGGQQPMPANVGAAGGGNRRNRKLKVSPAESDVSSYRSTDAGAGSHGRGFDGGRDSAGSGGAGAGSHGRRFDSGRDSAGSGGAGAGSHGRGFDGGRDSAWSGGTGAGSHGRRLDSGRDSAWSGGAADGGVQRCEPRVYGASLPPPRKQLLGRGGPTTDNKQEAECSICCSEITNRKVLEKCKHAFCAPCIDTWFAQKPTCPVCGQSYGAVTGNQPDGTMTWHDSPMNLPGHPGCGTIVIDYCFFSGIQTASHPSPGKPYSGTTRTAYLPGNPQGRHVLRLLKMAFDAKLTFTIGTSVTTGVDNTVTWNDIHHKTNMGHQGMHTEYGYPDPEYLNRVTEELAAKGISVGNDAFLPRPRKQPLRRGDPTDGNKQASDCSII